ncbi:MAG TPA: FAD-dependent oxidoreductase, partial [Gemmatimonadales bacterium]
GAVARFAASLWRRPELLLRAAGYRAAFRGARHVTGSWVTAAHGTSAVERVTVTDGRHETTLDCDLLCVGHGLVPATELARLAGCSLAGGAVVVDHRQETTVRGLYCAGEPTGIGGADLSLIEGEIAGLCAAGSDDDAAAMYGARATLRRHAIAMERAFAPRAELRDTCTADTIVCRCEDVTRGEIDPTWCARQAKLYTRAGMGPCQGRVCGPALEFLLGWAPDAVRPPIEPVLLATLLPDAAAEAAPPDHGAA